MLGLDFRVQGLGFRVLGFRILGLVFRIYAVGFRISFGSRAEDSFFSWFKL